MSQFQINCHEDRHIWDKFVATSEQRSIFVFSKFLDSLEVPYDLVTCYKGDTIVAGTPVIYTSHGLPRYKPFPFTQYQGMLLADHSGLAKHSKITFEFKIMEFFIAELVAKYKTYCLCQSWRFPDLRPFQWYNYHEFNKDRFQLDLRYTGILDVHRYCNFEHYLTSIRKVKRQEFTKACNQLSLQTDTNIEVMDELHAKTFARQDLERTDEETIIINSIAKNALAMNYGDLYFATLNGEPVSAGFFLYDDRTAYYLIGANDPIYRKTYSGTFLLIHMIKAAFEKGIQEIDFLGLNSPARGDFKISLGAVLTPHFNVVIGS